MTIDEAVRLSDYAASISPGIVTRIARESPGDTYDYRLFLTLPGQDTPYIRVNEYRRSVVQLSIERLTVLSYPEVNGGTLHAKTRQHSR